MVEKTLNDIYRDIENEVEEECFDKEDLKLKDQDPYVIVGKSITSGNILLKVGDELGYDVTKSLTLSSKSSIFLELLIIILDLSI